MDSASPPSPRWPGRDAPLLALAALLVLVAANLPYIAGWLFAPPGWRFSGMVGSVQDVASYYAKMRVGHDGRWLYVSAYTTEPHNAAFIYMYYVALGHAARLASLSIPVVYQLARAANALLLLAAAHAFLFRLGFSRLALWLALALIFTGGGVGWILRLPGVARVPPEFWFLEAYVFQSLVAYPHFTLSTALILLLLAEMRSNAKEPSQPALARAAAASFLLGCVHPRAIVVPLMAGGAAALLGARGDLPRLRRWAQALAAALLGFLPAAAAALLTLSGDPVWQATQTPTPMPFPPIFLFAYGFLWPLGALGAWRAFRRREEWAPLILGWIIVGAFLPYAPIGAQRRLVHGLNVPLAIGAADLFLAAAMPRLAARPRALRAAATAAFIGLLSLSSWVYLAHESRQAARAMFPQSFPEAQASAMRWIESNTPPDAVVMAKPIGGMFIPAQTGRRVVFGHWAETIDPKYKNWAVEKFFSAQADPKLREEIIKSFNAAWVYTSPQESSPADYGFAQEPARWRLAWSEGGHSVYERLGPADLAGPTAPPAP